MEVSADPAESIVAGGVYFIGLHEFESGFRVGIGRVAAETPPGTSCSSHSSMRVVHWSSMRLDQQSFEFDFIWPVTQSFKAAKGQNGRGVLKRAVPRSCFLSVPVELTAESAMNHFPELHLVVSGCANSFRFS
eukprot:6212087-Pleurochrysis_carterae.AAC.4